MYINMYMISLLLCAYQLSRAISSPPITELDRLKEQIAYLKFWQGIMVVTDISLVGWLISSATEAALSLIFVAVLGVILISLGAVILHRQIERRIDQVGEL
jgi:heme O synthase-like polyprenyltransferase